MKWLKESLIVVGVIKGGRAKNFTRKYFQRPGM